MIEIWKHIPGYKNHYMASSLGKITSLKHRHGKRKTPHQLKINLSGARRDYPTVVLCKKSKPKSYKVHFLVLRSFVGKRPKGFIINHLNGIKTDNRLENLEYTTYKENYRHAIALGLSTGKPNLGKKRNK